MGLKDGRHFIAFVPGDEAALLDQINAGGSTTSQRLAEVALDANSVILVGERAAGFSGRQCSLRLAERTGARLAWAPRRAGDRGAVEAGCLPLCCLAADRSPTPLPAWTPKRRGESDPCRPWKVATPTRS